MAIEKRKREDLLHEATAYSRRLLLKLACGGSPCELFGGQRPEGGWGIYFDESPVLQFNAAGALRRVFVEDRKLAAESGRLVELKRDVCGGRVEHQRVVLPNASEREVLQGCLTWLKTASAALHSNNFELLGQVPAEDTRLMADFLGFVDSLLPGLSVAESAAAQA